MAHPHTVPFLPAIPSDVPIHEDEGLKLLENELKEERDTGKGRISTIFGSPIEEKVSRGGLSTFYVAPNEVFEVFTDSPDSRGYVGTKRLTCCKKTWIGICTLAGCVVFVLTVMFSVQWNPYVAVIFPILLLMYLCYRAGRRYCRRKRHANGLSVRYERLRGDI